MANGSRNASNIFASPSNVQGRRAALQRLQTDPTHTPPGRQPQMYLHSSASDSRITPKARDRMSTGSAKRRGTPAAEFMENAAQYGSPRSLRNYAASDHVVDDSLEIVDPNDIGDDENGNGEEGFEGVENVRACKEPDIR